MGVKLCIGDRQLRVKGNFALRVQVARNQEIKPDRRVRVRPWFGILGFRGCGHYHRGDYPERNAERRPAEGRCYSRFPGTTKHDT
jgi:hypothetical protein